MQDKYRKIDKNNKLKFEKADILILIEFIVSVVMAAIAHFFLKQEIIAGIVLMVGILITMSTYILKGHIINENRKQSEEHKKYLKRVKLWVDIEHHKDMDIRKRGDEIIRNADTALNEIIEGTWEVRDRFELDTVIKEYVQESEHTILATHIDAKKWEESHSFRELFEENVKARKKGVMIHRIFILWERELTEPTGRAVREIVGKHKEVGIKVECVRNSDIPPGKAKDFMIFDDKKVIVENLSPDFAEFTDGIVSKNVNIVKEWKKTFERISTQANEDLDEFFRTNVHPKEKHSG